MTSFFCAARKAAPGVLLAAITLFGFSACRKDRGEQVSAPVAGVMAFNLSTDKVIGFSVSGTNLYNSPLAFSSYTGSYVSVFPGQYALEAFDAFSNTGNSLANVGSSFEANNYYSVFFLGTDSSYRNVVVNDNIDSLQASTGRAYLRYINGIPDSSSEPLVTVSSGETTVINDNAVYGSISAFTAVSPGEISITAKNAAGINVNRMITVEAKKVYTILLAGLPGSGATPVAIKYVSHGTGKQACKYSRTADSDTIH